MAVSIQIISLYRVCEKLEYKQINRYTIMFKDTINHNGKVFTIEIIKCDDINTDKTYFAVFVAIKREFKRYEVCNVQNPEMATQKAKEWIEENF